MEKWRTSTFASRFSRFQPQDKSLGNEFGSLNYAKNYDCTIDKSLVEPGGLLLRKGQGYSSSRNLVARARLVVSLS